MAEIGKLLFIIGGFIVLLGLLMVLAQYIPFIGKLPGDIVIKKDGFSLYFPIVTFLLLSIVLTVIVNLILYLKR